MKMSGILQQHFIGNFLLNIQMPLINSDEHFSVKYFLICFGHKDITKSSQAFLGCYGNSFLVNQGR